MEVIKQVEPIYNVATAAYKGVKTGKKIKKDFDELTRPIEEETLWGKTKAVAGKAKTAVSLAQNVQVEVHTANKILKNAPKAIKGVSNLFKWATGKGIPGVNFGTEFWEKNKDSLAAAGLTDEIVDGLIKGAGGTVVDRIKRSANNLGFSFKRKAQLVKGKVKNSVQNLLGEDGEIYYLLKKRMFKIENGEVVEVEPGMMDRFLRLDALTRVARMNAKKKISYEDKDGNVYQFNSNNRLVKVYDAILDRFVNIEVEGEYPELLSLNKRMQDLGEEFEDLHEKYGNFSTEGLSTTEASNAEGIIGKLIEKLIEPTGEVNNQVLKDFVKSALDAGVDPKRIEGLLKANDPSEIQLNDQETAIYNFFRARESGSEVVVDNAMRVLEELNNIPLKSITKDGVSFTKFTDIVSLLSQSSNNLSNYSASLRADMGIGRMFKVSMLTGQVLNTFSPISVMNLISTGMGCLALLIAGKTLRFGGRALWSLVKAGTKAILGKNKVIKVKKEDPFDKNVYKNFLKDGFDKEMAKKLAQRVYKLKIEDEIKQQGIQREESPEPDFSIPYYEPTYRMYIDELGSSKHEAIEAARDVWLDGQVYDFYTQMKHSKRKNEETEENSKKIKNFQENAQFFPNPFTSNPKTFNLDIPETFETRRSKSGKKYRRKQPVYSSALVSKEIQMGKPKYTLAQAYAFLKKAKTPETKKKWRAEIRRLQSLESNARLYGYDQPLFDEDQSKYRAAGPPSIVVEEPGEAPIRSSVIIEDDVISAGPPSLHTQPTIPLSLPPSRSSSDIVLYSNSSILDEEPPAPPSNSIPVPESNDSDIGIVSFPRPICFVCGKFGHYGTNCPNRRRNSSRISQQLNKLKKTVSKTSKAKKAPRKRKARRTGRKINACKSTLTRKLNTAKKNLEEVKKTIDRAPKNTFRQDSKPKSSRSSRGYCHCGGCCSKCCV